MNKEQNTIWIDIKKRLESEIIAQKYLEMQKMPSIAEVSLRYHCGRSTAKKILENMYQEGYLIKKKGIGYFIKPGTRAVVLEKHKRLWNSQAQELVKEALQMGTDVIGNEDAIASNIQRLVIECKNTFA